MTHNTQHTPGPWLVTGNQRNGHFDFVLPMADDKDFQANARLIASAPDMYNLLKRISDDPNLDFENEGIQLIENLLAKAEGR